MLKEETQGQFNFINSQLRMNENHVENQNEYEKMSSMVKNLVSCKIENIFKDIDHTKEDLKTRIKLAIEADEKASTSIATLAVTPQQTVNANANAAESQAKIDALNKQIDDLKKGNDSNSQSKIAELITQLEELNKKSVILPVTSSDDLTKANAEIERLKAEIAKLNAKNDELKIVYGVAIGTNSANDNANANNNNNANTTGTNNGTNNNNNPQSNNSKNTFTDFVIGHHTPE